MESNYKVTIKDVANYANVAVSTVSRVINGMDRVSEETRDRVNNAIRELGYVRNDLAAAMKTGATRFVVVVVPDLVNESYTSVIRGVEAVSRGHGYYTLVYTVGDTIKENGCFFDERIYSLVEGIVIVPSDNMDEQHLHFEKPFVVVDRVPVNHSISSVTLDNYYGSKQLTQYLIDRGHRKIAFVSGYSKFSVFYDRLAGYKDTLIANGIDVNSSYICIDGWHYETGYNMTHQLLALPIPPTAIFSANNRICVGCADYLLKHNYSIGKNISLVQFDDSEISRYLGNGITCISHPTYEMGSSAAEVLFSMVENRSMEMEASTIVMPVHLEERHSVAFLQ